jgi:HEAT repeat protein
LIALIDSLDDESNLVRDEAIDGLARINDERAIDPLVRLLHEPERSAVVEHRGRHSG